MGNFPQSVPPSSLSGIKRLAKSIRKQNQIPYLEALDKAAQSSGYENYHHARHVLERAMVDIPLKQSYSIYLSAYWRDTSSMPVQAGLETIKIDLPRPLLSFLLKHQCNWARNLEAFYVECEDHLEMRPNAGSQVRARELLHRAALTLQFLEATGLRPATTRPQRKIFEVLERLPGKDHQSLWISSTGEWLALDEPYSHALEHPYQDEREAWITAQNLHWVRPTWGGLYYPGNAVPHLISANQNLLHQVEQVVQSLPPVKLGKWVDWPWVSARYSTQFESPTRQTTGKRRKPRPGTTYGWSKNAVEYRTQIGVGSWWRPDQSMPLASHFEAGEICKRLRLSNLPIHAYEKIGGAQSELEDWMYAEMRREGRVATAIEDNAYYGGKEVTGYQENDQKLIALDRLCSILTSSYPDCKPLRDMLSRLAAARAGVAKAVDR